MNEGKSHPLSCHVSCIIQITILFWSLHRTPCKQLMITFSLQFASRLVRKLWGGQKCNSDKEKRKGLCCAVSVHSYSSSPTGSWASHSTCPDGPQWKAPSAFWCGPGDEPLLLTHPGCPFVLSSSFPLIHPRASLPPWSWCPAKSPISWFLMWLIPELTERHPLPSHLLASSQDQSWCPETTPHSLWALLLCGFGAAFLYKI